MEYFMIIAELVCLFALVAVLIAYRKQIEAQKKEINQLQQQINCDPKIPRIASYNHFQYIVESDLKRLHQIRERGKEKRKAEQQAAFFLFDMDNFHCFNEKHGYITGDHALLQTVQVIFTQFRIIDIVITRNSHTSDEFLVYVSRMGYETALERMDTIEKKISATPIRINGEKIFFGITGGLAIFPELQTFKELLEAAGRMTTKRKKEKGIGR